MGRLGLFIIPYNSCCPGMASVPGWAQNASQPPSTQQQPANKPEIGLATVSPSGIPPSQRNPLLTDNGDVRIGKMIGTNIYYKNDKQIGRVGGVTASGAGSCR
jgi:hypothetical protein